MAKEWAKPFYDSTAWRSVRNAYISQRIAIDGGLCEECHELPGVHVHHITILTPDNIKDANVSLSFNNLKFLCKQCHDEQDNHFNSSRSRQNRNRKQSARFDANGQPLDMRHI